MLILVTHLEVPSVYVYIRVPYHLEKLSQRGETSQPSGVEFSIRFSLKSYLPQPNMNILEIPKKPRTLR